MYSLVYRKKEETELRNCKKKYIFHSSESYNSACIFVYLYILHIMYTHNIFI